MLSCVHDWAKAIDDGDFVDVAYLDYAKAFDTVCHQKLLIKLDALGVKNSVLRWIKSFLSDRTQSVIVNDARSHAINVTSSVPQGSVLGPILFRVYVDDITRVVKHCEVRLFADDTKLYLRVKKDAITNLLQQDLENIFEWSTKWQLGLALQKCVILPIRGSHSASAVPHIVVNNTELPTAENVRDLGVHISSNLKSSYHISKVVRSAHVAACSIHRAFTHEQGCGF